MPNYSSEIILKNKNKGCFHCKYLKVPTLNDKLVDFECKHPSNIKKIPRWYQDLIKYKKNIRQLNKKRKCPYYTEPQPTPLGD